LLYKETENISKNIKPLLRLQPLSQDSTSASSPTSKSGCRDDFLIYPKQIPPESQKEIGQRLLARISPEIAQQVLDVIANAYQQPKGVSSLGGFISTLLTRVEQGTFDPLPGLAVAVKREQQRANEAILEQRRKSSPLFHGATDAVQGQPPHREERRVRTPEVQKFLDGFLKKPLAVSSTAEPQSCSRNTSGGVLPPTYSGGLVLSSARRTIIRKR